MSARAMRVLLLESIEQAVPMTPGRRYTHVCHACGCDFNPADKPRAIDGCPAHGEQVDVRPEAPRVEAA